MPGGKDSGERPAVEARVCGPLARTRPSSPRPRRPPPRGPGHCAGKSAPHTPEAAEAATSTALTARGHGTGDGAGVGGKCLWAPRPRGAAVRGEHGGSRCRDRKPRAGPRRRQPPPTSRETSKVTATAGTQVPLPLRLTRDPAHPELHLGHGSETATLRSSRE